MLDYFLNISNSTYCFTSIYCAGLLLVLIFEHRKRLKYVQSSFFKLNGSKIFRYEIRERSDKNFQIVFLFLFVSLFLAIFHFVPPLTLISSAIFYYIYSRFCVSMDDVIRKPNHIILLLLSLAFLPDWFVDEKNNDSQLVVYVVLVILSQMYGSSAYQKLKKSGLKWMDGYSIRYYLKYHHLMYGNRLPLILSNYPIKLLSFFSWLTILFEATFFLTLFFPSLIPIYSVLGISFHLSTLIIMRINYFRLVMLIYLGLLIIYYLY